MKLTGLLKKAVSVICASAIGLSILPAAFAKDFADVADTAPYKTAVDELYALGILSGYEDGSIRPEDNITRAEVTKLVVAAMGPSYTEAAVGATGVNTQFYDVPGSHWASGYISTGVANGFINGNGDGSFTPENNVTYAEIVKMMVCAMGYGAICERNGGWPNGYLTTAASIGVTKGVNVVGADTIVTRGQVAMIVNNGLNIPIVGITGYEESAVTGMLIVKTDIMDNISSGGDAKDYQTMLTKNHNTYKVKGRIIATKRSDSSLDENEVKFKIESTSNFEGYAYGKTYLNPVAVDMIYNYPNAQERMFIYGDAVIYINNDSDYEILSFTPYGSNDTTVTQASLFAEYDLNGANIESVTMYKSEDSSKTEKFKLDPYAAVYVNGVEMSNKVTAINNYLVNNQLGTVSFVDATDEGKTTTDGKYDYIIINYYVDAVVDTYNVSNGMLKIYFKDNDPAIRGSMRVDLEDEDISLAFNYKYGNYDYEDIQPNDVFSIAYDVTDSFADSTFYDVYVSRDVVDGRVDATKTDSSNRTLYQINGKYYSMSSSMGSGSVSVGSYYTLYVNAFGKIVKSDETSANSLIGIIERVYMGDDGEYYVRLIANTGMKTTYMTRDSSAYSRIKATFDAMSGNLEDRVVKYTINSSGRITNVTKVDAVRVDNASYRASSNKLNSYSLSTYTNVIDLTFSENNVDVKNGISTVKKVDVDSFADSGEYGVVLAERSKSDGTYRYVFVYSGAEAYTGDTMIAVMTGSVVEYDDEYGEPIRVLSVYEEGNDNIAKLKVDSTCSTTVNAGDVFVYKTDGDGYVTEIIKIFDKISTTNGDYERFLTAVMSSDYTYRDNCRLFASFLGMPSGWLASTTATKTGKVDVIFAPIIQKYGSSVTLGVLNNQLQSPELTHQVDYTVAHDANIYVYDYAEGKHGERRVSVGNIGSVRKTNIPESCKLYEGSERTNIDWKAVDEQGNPINFLVGKVVDGDITEALVILGEKTSYSGAGLVVRYSVNAYDCSVSTGAAKAGETVSVTYTVPEGKELEGIYINRTGDAQSTKIDGTTFTMPSYDVDVKAVFTDKTYALNVDSETPAAAAVTFKIGDAVATRAKSGDIVTVEYAAQSGMTATVYVNNIAIAGNTFTMTAADTTVKVVYEADTFSLTSADAVLKVNDVAVTFANPGDIVTVEYTVPENKTFEGIYVNNNKIEGQTFTMPSENVTVVVNYTAMPMNITAVDCTTNIVSAVPGQTVTVMCIPPANHEVDKITVNNAEISGNTFVMPQESVTVKATYKEKMYSLTALNCTLSAASAKAGETITVVPAEASSGKQFAGIVVNSNVINGNSFVMPAENTRVEAVYSAKDYTITTQNCSADKHTAKPGDIITLTATAEAGKEIGKFYVNGTAVNGRTFTMPAADVTVTVDFTDKMYDIKTKNCTTDKQSAKKGETITVSYSTPSEKKFEYITLNGIKLAGNTFEMPAGEAVVEAVYTNVMYNITASGCTVSKNTAAAGEVVGITFNAPAGQKIDKVTINGVLVAKVENTFTMPGRDTAIVATYTDITYPITASNCKVNVTEAKPGQNVTVTWTVPANQVLESIKLNGTALKFDSKSNSLTFPMPSVASTIVASFKTLIQSTQTLSPVKADLKVIKGTEKIQLEQKAPIQDAFRQKIEESIKDDAE